MIVNQAEIEASFSVDDVVSSGGERTNFRITDILPDRVRIQPTESPTSSRLRYDKLSIVINNFTLLNRDKIEESVGNILRENGLQDTQNESYLYGFSREYLRRKNLMPVSLLEYDFKEELINSRNGSVEDRRARLENAERKPPLVSGFATTYRRNPDVVVEVLERANGTCERCNLPAPFLRAKDNSPYLEVHHTDHLANGGYDTVENAEALCPNCHRKAHFGANQ